MKRRVVQGKENKKTHRALHAAFGASAPYMVLVDSTTARAWSGLKGSKNPLPDMIEKGLEADAELRCVPATRRVTRGMGSEVLAALHGCGLYTVGGTNEDRNEHKAIVAALQVDEVCEAVDQ